MLTSFKLFTKIFKNRNDRVLLRMKKVVDMINYIEKDIQKLNDSQLASKTNEFRASIESGVNLENLLPQAFAVVREAIKRIFNIRLFDVQLLGGIVLNSRCIAEMKTGEGKTLTATLPAYLNALSGQGVHIVTVNNYLAHRDAVNNKPLFEFLGLTVGINLPGLSASMKRAAYTADITYGTNNEYGFDYLRDNMVFVPEERVQRGLHYALIDEVDSILIDEARTPLVISGPSDDTSLLYLKINELVFRIIQKNKRNIDNLQKEEYFAVDEKSRQVILTENGLVLIEQLLIKSGIMNQGESLYSSDNIILMHHVNAAFRAHILFACEVDYLVKNGEILIIDEHTGRVMPGRRWSDGLHQAIEAKEHVTIQNENQTLASITFQNYFRLYEKLSGMTGTANTEAFEFQSIYKLDTIVIPTNRPMIRNDFPDIIYMTEHEKIEAIINDIKDCVKRNQPVLVGTISIDKSEIISHALSQIGIMHKVLNAKFHAAEADIIAQAGYPGAVTIATNMAGRGTDIILGGNWRAEITALHKANTCKILKIKSDWEKRHHAVLKSGGLHVIGTERHESRRIDNQLRGRSGRQGDIGSSRFYLSMEDSLIRIFASNRLVNMMKKLGMKSGESIEHPWITKAIAHAQKKVENRNFDIRKQLLEYDDVANDQRRVIYEQRDKLLNISDISDIIKNIRCDVVEKLFNIYIPLEIIEDKRDVIKLEECLKKDFCLELPLLKWIEVEPRLYEEKEILRQRILENMTQKYEHTRKIIGIDIMCSFEKEIMLRTFDVLWKEHLASMDYLRQGIHLRGYAQKDPKQEYKRESFSMFTKMLDHLKYEVISEVSKLVIELFNKKESILNSTNKYNDFQSINTQVMNTKLLSIDRLSQHTLTKNKIVSRNDACPCGSNKKFKECHGKIVSKRH
ncbi:preprotein translocase subunit SecA [Blochmannia endosymbiont of Camponotus modoc]|uniref:preprotein translocase subunit SecA n=1 Tax=Blochmannia endosymbiont of Camponotus modoc TaxID=2945587 RepID=UPI00202563AA|nr:preprotein translocase subunit SecA [Blochmannia endosymbiont of Camponotus modoc]URJ29291.1 preprotein translocase subunit SecA [Blochmannia endosymbiont of Camponotus modoc]